MFNAFSAEFCPFSSSYRAFRFSISAFHFLKSTFDFLRSSIDFLESKINILEDASCFPESILCFLRITIGFPKDAVGFPGIWQYFAMGASQVGDTGGRVAPETVCFAPDATYMYPVLLPRLKCGNFKCRFAGGGVFDEEFSAARRLRCVTYICKIRYFVFIFLEGIIKILVYVGAVIPFCLLFFLYN